MRIDVATLFPEMCEAVLSESILGRARKNGALTVQCWNIRDYTLDKHRRVDDVPYGGGRGMVMQAEPVYAAVKDLEGRMSHKPRVIYLTPQGSVFRQEMAVDFAKEEDLVFLCGHYEGIDERVLEEVVTDYVSIGDYVLTGGELPAMVMIDAISRMVPGVLSNGESGTIESFHDNLLEYPQYSRPEVWHDTATPPVLMSGHHANVERWRRDQSLYRTLKHRPDLLDGVELDKKDRKFLRELLEKEPVEQLPFTSGTAAWSGEKGVADPYPVRDTEQKVLRKLLAISNKA